MNQKQQGGFTLIEMTISGVLIASMMYLVSLTMGTSKKAYETSNSRFDATESVRRVLRRVSDEVRSASRWGEDVNGNGVLDTGEDTNNNSRLERDWAVTSTSLTFNRMLPSQRYDLPTTYRLQGEDLIRSHVVDTSGKTVDSIVARGITGFLVTLTGDTIDVQVSSRASTGKSVSSESISINMRN